MKPEIAFRKAKPQAKPYKISDGGGLYLHVFPDDKKYWRLAYRYGGKQKTLAIGVYDGVTTVQARDARDKAKRLLREGKDPGAEKKAKRLAIVFAANNTFETVAREWHSKQLHKWSPDHADTVINSLATNVFPTIGSRPIKEVTSLEFLDLLRVIENRGALDLLRRVYQRCHDVFAYAVVTGRCQINVATGLNKALAKNNTKHFASIKKEELTEFLKKLKEDNAKPVTKAAARLLMLTFVRTNELRFAKWGEFDLDAATWTVPGERMKGKHTRKERGEIPPHIVPLPSQAIETLRELHAITGNSPEGYLFPNPRDARRPMSENAILYAIYRVGYKGKMTGHGFRSLASTILNDSGLWSPDAIERQLAHTEKNKVRAAYDRGARTDERRRMLDWWGQYIEAAENGGNVVPFQREAQA